VFAHARSDGDDAPLASDLVAGKAAPGGAAVYVCRNFTCDAPVARPEALREALARA
jgi:uncharacterized protein YyaL (SSP411 family)